jgi:N-sulfoglucosamine sulfohydrolase
MPNSDKFEGCFMDVRPNILLITADDMNWDAVGAFGCRVPGTTPNIDRLAAQGVCFDHAHVTVAVCQPSRSTLLTGRYPHRHGGEGFFHLRHAGVPILPDTLRQAGYCVGILGKVRHSTPYGDFAWDMVHDQSALGKGGRNPTVYRQRAADFMDHCNGRRQPFFLMLNSHDPHRPFYGNDNPDWYKPENGPPALAPSRTFKPGEIVVPGFLPDLPDVRVEVAEYYNSVRRCDDIVGHTLDALRDRALEDNTIVIFLSDNGMAFPFAKTNCYLHSTRTPWIVRWPAKAARGVHDRTHFISGIDLMPTVLDAAGVAPPPGMDGESFMPLLRGESQNGRDLVFTQFHQTAMKMNYPMRCVQNRRFGYIFNPWSDGQRIFLNEAQAGRTMAAMRRAAELDPLIAQRVHMFLHRVPEELYDFEADPDALNNLVYDPDYQDVLQSLRDELERWMKRTNDPALEAFRHRESRQALDDFMAATANELGGDS